MIGPPGLPVRFRLVKGGRDFHVPHVPPRVLLRVFADNAWWSVIPQMLPPDDQAYLFERLNDPDDRFDLVQMYRVGTRVLGAVVGWEWHIGQRLAVKARERWTAFDAWSVRHGFDPYDEAMPPARLFNALWSFLTFGISKDSEAAKLEAELLAPPTLPPSILEEAPLWSSGEEADAFDGAFAMFRKEK